jgi:hypothetical protein
MDLIIQALQAPLFDKCRDNYLNATSASVCGRGLRFPVEFLFGVTTVHGEVPMAFGVLLLVAALVALCWKKREPILVPGEKQTTLKPWVALVLFLLALYCFASSSSGETKQAEHRQDNIVPVRITHP